MRETCTSGSERGASSNGRPYRHPEFPQAGGLMSYGAKIADAWRQVGAYAGKILKGAKPSDLPVVSQPKSTLSLT